MMWEQIGSAAIYGAIGGGLGALIGGLLATPFKNTRFAQTASISLTVLFVVIGINFAQPVLSPYIGKHLQKSDNEQAFDQQYEVMLAELKSLPTLAAILEREPRLADDLKNEMRSALQKASTPVAANMLVFSASHALIQKRFLHYVVRAKDADLLVFLETNIDITRDLLERDPRFCYDMNYNPAALNHLRTLDSLREKIGAETFDRQQLENAQLVKNADDDIPSYDIAIATSELENASAAMIDFVGMDKIGLINGQTLAVTLEDATLGCEATLKLFASVLAQEHPVIVGRHIFASAL